MPANGDISGFGASQGCDRVPAEQDVGNVGVETGVLAHFGALLCPSNGQFYTQGASSPFDLLESTRLKSVYLLLNLNSRLAHVMFEPKV